MKLFHCDNCQQRVFFENVTCVSCGHVLAFVPDRVDIEALVPVDATHWRSLSPDALEGQYRLCSNYQLHQACNWAVPAEDPNPLCSSCRLSRAIPDLSVAANHEAWRKLEAAKRRLVYSLLHLRLTFRNREEDPSLGLAFEFLSDAAAPADEPVLTGHDSGVITINIAEADDAERERRRRQLHEPYRTLLGHLRHEVGHYYWDVIFSSGSHVESFRTLFGDERIDYAESLKHHYEQGAPVDWQGNFISAYASTHPWEDWAESWAHYLHMTDALETAAASGITIETPDSDGNSSIFSTKQLAGSDIRAVPFDTLLDHWLQLATVVNNLNRSLGLPDGYPFVLSQPAIEKLRFVHETIRSLDLGTAANAASALPLAV